MQDRRSDPDPDIVDGQRPAQIGRPVVDLRASPNGARDRQLLLGDAVMVLGEVDGAAYIRAEKDGYVGFVPASALTEPLPPTHRIDVRASHLYETADIKSSELGLLSFGCTFTVCAEAPGFLETSLGFVPVQHVAPAENPRLDAPDTAQLFLGTPYLWGGNSSSGIDCSGLVQIALLTAGIPCPGDSDQQFAALGQDVPLGTVRRGDLLFWKGHVAMALDSILLIHANAHHMSVAIEPIAAARVRIEMETGERLQAVKRL